MNCTGCSVLTLPYYRFPALTLPIVHASRHVNGKVKKGLNFESDFQKEIANLSYAGFARI